MNVLFLDSIDTGTYGGMEEWIRLVAGGLARRGHKTMAAGRDGSEFLRRVGSAGVETAPLSISGDFNPATISKIKQKLGDDDFDLICVNFTKDIRLGGLAARWSGSTKVVWSVGLDITKDSFVHRTLTPKLVDAVIVPSESLKSQITARGYIRPDIVRVIPIGIEDRPDAVASSAAAAQVRAICHLPSDAVIGVTVGRFVPQKGHATLIEALPEIIQGTPQFYSLLLGNGPLESKIRAAAHSLGVVDRLIFGGMVDDVAPIVAGADLMIHPSVEEPFGIAVLEGMRAGLPLVASNVGGVPEVVGNSGGAKLVEPRNAAALAQAVSRLLKDRGAMEASGRFNRQRFVDHYQLEKMIDRVEAAFRAVAPAEPRHG